MVFYSLRTSDNDSFDRIYYSYANEDFTDLEGEPIYMFDNGKATIDGDIVFNEADNLYHLFYKSESGRGIFQATAKQLTAEPGKRIKRFSTTRAVFNRIYPGRAFKLQASSIGL